MVRRGTTAKQRAAAKRNIVKAQRRSAELRRAGHGKGKNGSSTFYGKGRKGRRAARKSTYGTKRHGLSIAQQQRRKQRANKWKRRAGLVATAATTGAAVYTSLYPEHAKKTKAKVAMKTRDYGENVHIQARATRMTYKVNRTMGHSRATSARAARPRVKRK